MNVLSALAAPFGAIWREIRGVLASPLAFFGGIGGMLLMCGLLAAFFLYAGKLEGPEEEEDLWDMDFQPGALVQIGKEIPEDELVITEETVARDEPVEEPPEEEVPEEEEQVAEEVTKDQAPAKEKKEPTKDKPKKILPKPSKEKPEDKPDAKKADHNTKKNNPYDDLPTHDQNRGDPFGDPGGWAEIAKDGDAWATAVMKALNNLKPPGWAGKLPSGTYKFRVTFCKNGTVSKVFDKGGTAPGDFKAAVKKEVERIKLPPIPAKHAKSMKGSCQTLPYVFTYKAGKTK